MKEPCSVDAYSAWLCGVRRDGETVLAWTDRYKLLFSQFEEGDTPSEATAVRLLYKHVSTRERRVLECKHDLDSWRQQIVDKRDELLLIPPFRVSSVLRFTAELPTMKLPLKETQSDTSNETKRRSSTSAPSGASQQRYNFWNNDLL